MNPLIGFIIGISILFILTVIIPIEYIEIESHSGRVLSNEGTYRISGKVTDIKSYESVSFVSLEYCQPIDIVVFDPLENITGNYASLLVDVQQRNGEKQLIAQSITVHSPIIR